MPDFAYIARDLSGNRVTGKLTAATAQEALSMLGQKALFPLQVEAEKQGSLSLLPGRRIKAQLMATTFGQLADLLRSGVPLLRSLDVVQKQSSNERLTTVLAEVRSRVEEGASLAEAMASMSALGNLTKPAALGMRKFHCRKRQVYRLLRGLDRESRAAMRGFEVKDG